MTQPFGTEASVTNQRCPQICSSLMAGTKLTSTGRVFFHRKSEVMTRRSVPLGILIVVLTLLAVGSEIGQSGLTEAPAGFDNQTNGFVSQAQFDLDRAVFIEQDGVEEGLGPVYNAQSCGECHQNPVAGGISQVTELRAGFFDGRIFIDEPGGSLIHDRAIDPSIQERVLEGSNVATLRTSLNTLGDGFV